MKPIEYRFLQLILSHVAGDRLTLALIHWDGERLRVASSFAPLAQREWRRQTWCGGPSRRSSRGR